VMSVIESVSLSENLTKEAGLAVATLPLAVIVAMGLTDVGMEYLLWGYGWYQRQIYNTSFSKTTLLTNFNISNILNILSIQKGSYHESK